MGSLEIHSFSAPDQPGRIRMYTLISMRLIYYVFRYLRHYLTWQCSSISEDLGRFARNFQHLSAKLFLLLFLNNFRPATHKIVRNNNITNFALICCKFLANLQKSWNNMMSIDGLIIENMDLSHIHLAVPS